MLTALDQPSTTVDSLERSDAVELPKVKVITKVSGNITSIGNLIALRAGLAQKHIMSANISPNSPQMNRLRAAVGLVAIIERGLAKGTLTNARALSMIESCESARDQDIDAADARKLRVTICEGLERIKVKMAELRDEIAA